MRDINRRRATLAHHTLEGAQHVDLRGDVQCGGRFVEDHQQRVADQRHRRHHPLQLPARHLVRITLANGVRVGQGQIAEQLDGLGLQVCTTAQTVNQRAFDHLIDELFRRVECRGGTLRDVRNAVATQALQLAFGQAEHVMLADLNHAAGQFAAAPGITQQSQRNSRLARAGLADQRQHFAFFQREADAFDDFQLAVIALGNHAQVLYTNQLAHLNALPNDDRAVRPAGR